MIKDKADFAIDIQIFKTTINIEFEPLHNNIEETEEAARMLFKKLCQDLSRIDQRFGKYDVEASTIKREEN